MASPPIVTFVIEDDDGNRADVQLSGPGGASRLVIGEPDCQSGIWRIWANKPKSDVYIGIRSILGYQKWSLHESGDWRFQWVTEAKASEFTGSTDRLVDRWQQPPEVRAGWTKGFTIRVRHQDLVDRPGEVEPAGTVRLPAPPEGHATSVHVVVARPDQGRIALHGLLPVDGFTLADGRAVLLITSVDAVLAEQNQMVDAAMSEGVRQMRERGVDLSTVGSPRMLASGHDADGNRFVWDVAVRSC
jgi:hypothetical protein